ncbi:MAG: hypothetical protein IPL84_17830 [Chitinophagaceae bacterium]|nr:hypothetical protein [Chitinophagaceae bacterium]
MKNIITIIACCLIANSGFAQSGVDYSNTKKGQFYLLWGWNRAAYTKSNISFKGNDYDFKLYKVSAHDRPTTISATDYLRIDRITIPQTNFRLGYFIRKNLAISFGFDHMKYVMDNDQTVFMKGTIQRDGSFKGEYNGDKKLTEDFLTFEHTDGLNYINVEAEKYVNLYHAASNNCNIDALIGAGGGILMPRTNVHLLNYAISDRFHVSGFGVSLKAGIQATLFKHLVIKLENKYGYINMPDIVLHKSNSDGKGKQAFFFYCV